MTSYISNKAVNGINRKVGDFQGVKNGSSIPFFIPSIRALDDAKVKYKSFKINKIS